MGPTIRETTVLKTSEQFGEKPAPVSNKYDDRSLTRRELTELFAPELKTIRPLSQVA